MKEVRQYLENLTQLANEKYIVVAVSGGPDSMALLHMLLEQRQHYHFQIVCAHVNHNVRKESEEEAIFVSGYCHSHGILYEFMKIENYHDDNFHNEARVVRYRFFEQILSKYQSHCLFTAHHGDDLMETILMRMVRGASLKGYSGFEVLSHRENYDIIRPLIFVTKKELLDYVNDYDIPYVKDASNEKDVYTRNRYRKYVLPFLKKEDASVHKKFYKFSKTLLEYENYINRIVKEKMTEIVDHNEIDISLFQREDPLIQKEMIIQMLSELYEDDLFLITDRHTEQILKLCRSSKKNAKVCLPQNMYAIRAYNSLNFEKDYRDVTQYKYEIQDNVKLPNQHEIEVVSDSNMTNNNICYLSKEDIALPLYVRSRQDGDKMYVKGLDGRKKINDIFIDEKIPIEQRNLWPIVVDSNENIVWIPGLKKSKFDRTKGKKYDIILKYH